MKNLTRVIGALGLSLAALTAGPARATDPALSAPFQPLDYRQDSHWVCRPDGCRDDLSATILAPDGSARREAFRPAADPAVDCFYVYPTVSHSPGLLADPVVTRDERRAVIQQVERFTGVCRLFVPLYRQVTVT